MACSQRGKHDQEGNGRTKLLRFAFCVLDLSLAAAYGGAADKAAVAPVVGFDPCADFWYLREGAGCGGGPDWVIYAHDQRGVIGRKLAEGALEPGFLPVFGQVSSLGVAGSGVPVCQQVDLRGVVVGP